jgi:hypothetical protein
VTDSPEAGENKIWDGKRKEHEEEKDIKISQNTKGN